MTLDEFTQAHHHRLLGLIVDGLIHTQPANDARIRLLSRLPSMVDGFLQQLYLDARRTNRVTNANR